MKQSLIDIKETKQGLRPDKENSSGMDFKDQVQRFSQRIDQLLEQKHDKDVNKMKNRRLKMEMQRMRVQRIVKEQLTRERAGDERFKEDLLHRLGEHIDREMRPSVWWRSPSARERSDSRLNESGRTFSARSFKSNKASFNKAPTSNHLSRTQVSERGSRSKSARRRSSKRSCEKMVREFNLSKMQEHGEADRQRSKSRSRLSSVKSLDSHRSHRSTRSLKRKKSRSSTSKAAKKTKKSAKQVQPYQAYQHQAYQTECLNSKNSTIVHQCKASASSARPQIAEEASAPNLLSRTGGKGHKLNEILMNQACAWSTASRPRGGKKLRQPSGKRLRFHIDHLQESAPHDRDARNAWAVTQPSIGSGTMTGVGTHDPFSDPHACDCRPTVSPYSNKVDEASRKMTTAGRKSILKNSSAKKSILATPASNRFQSQSSSRSRSESQQGALSPAWRRARQLGSRVRSKHVLADSSSESDDSDSDEGFQYRSHAALIHEAGQTTGRGSSRYEAHLPKWQRLAVNQIRI